MARKRFNADEKALITAAAAGEVKIEWRNVTQWHPVRLTSPAVVTEDGWQHVTATVSASKGTVTAGSRIYISPGHLRALAG